jgi:hypothetical protein
VYAVRRALFPLDLAAETILDDVYVPMVVVLAGFRVAYAEEAVAFDHELDVRHEFVRKVRTLAGNWQLLSLLPALRNPLRGAAQWRYFWHKQARLLCPAALVAALAGGALAHGLLAHAVLWAQLAVYALALLAHVQGRHAGRVAVLCHTFVALNLAAAVALGAYLRGRVSVTWVRTAAPDPDGRLGAQPSIATSTGVGARMAARSVGAMPTRNPRDPPFTKTRGSSRIERST